MAEVDSRTEDLWRILAGVDMDSECFLWVPRFLATRADEKQGSLGHFRT